MPVSGTWISELDSGRFTATCYGGLNWVVDMKKISSRNATSTMGVMSMFTLLRRATAYDSFRSSRSLSTSYEVSSTRLLKVSTLVVK